MTTCAGRHFAEVVPSLVCNHTQVVSSQRLQTHTHTRTHARMHARTHAHTHTNKVLQLAVQQVGHTSINSFDIYSNNNNNII